MGQRVVLLVLLLLASVGAADDDSIFFRSTLPPAQTSYKFLFLTLPKFKTHTMLQHPLMVALANRGHKVVLLTENFWTDRHPNVTYLDHSVPGPDPTDFPIYDSIENPLLGINAFSKGVEQYAKIFFNDLVVQSLFKIRKEFDLIVVDELAFTCLYSFVHETTFALFSGSPIHQYGSANLGNPLNPAFVSSAVEEFPQPYSTWHRFKNCIQMLIHYILLGYYIPHSCVTEITSRFPTVPPPQVVMRNASLLMFNSDFTIDGAFPTVPFVVPIAGLAFKPAKPLPKEVSEFLSGDTPAILFSMGSSYSRSSHVPQEYKDIFSSVFSKLPYKVLFRFDEQLSQHSENLFIRDWLPQQDILAHPNVRACVIHGGGMSVHEAVRYGVPILGMPFLPEHKKMIQSNVYRGRGLLLEWSELSEQKLNESIMEIMQNPSYREKMAETSRIFKDQRESPLDRAVYWTEYVAKYRGAPHLQSPAKHLTWIEILNVDIIILSIFIAYVLLRIMMWSFIKLIAWEPRKRVTVQNKQKVH